MIAKTIFLRYSLSMLIQSTVFEGELCTYLYIYIYKFIWYSLYIYIYTNAVGNSEVNFSMSFKLEHVTRCEPVQ